MPTARIFFVTMEWLCRGRKRSFLPRDNSWELEALDSNRDKKDLSRVPQPREFFNDERGETLKIAIMRGRKLARKKSARRKGSQERSEERRSAHMWREVVVDIFLPSDDEHSLVRNGFNESVLRLVFLRAA